MIILPRPTMAFFAVTWDDGRRAPAGGPGCGGHSPYLSSIVDLERASSSANATANIPAQAPAVFAMISSTLGVRAASAMAWPVSIVTVVRNAIGSTSHRSTRKMSANSAPSGTKSRMFAENSMRAY